MSEGHIYTCVVVLLLQKQSVGFDSNELPVYSFFFFLSNDTLSVLRGESRTLMETHNLVPL